MHEFLLAFIGGTLLGISVVGYLYVNGRIAGISGLIASLLNRENTLKTPALWFLLGLFLVPFVYRPVMMPEIEIHSPPLLLIIAGLLVGIGTRMGSGCTSGHGICGISRLSGRSFVATVSFMLMGFVTVFLIRHLVGVS